MTPLRAALASPTHTANWSSVSIFIRVLDGHFGFGELSIGGGRAAEIGSQTVNCCLETTFCCLAPDFSSSALSGLVWSGLGVVVSGLGVVVSGLHKHFGAS